MLSTNQIAQLNKTGNSRFGRGISPQLRHCQWCNAKTHTYLINRKAKVLQKIRGEGLVCCKREECQTPLQVSTATIITSGTLPKLWKRLLGGAREDIGLQKAAQASCKSGLQEAQFQQVSGANGLLIHPQRSGRSSPSLPSHQWSGTPRYLQGTQSNLYQSMSYYLQQCMPFKVGLLTVFLTDQLFR